MKKKKRKTRRRYGILLLVIVLVAGLFFVTWNAKQIVFAKSNVVEYGSDTQAMDLVKSVSGGTIVNNPQLDTTEVGEKRIIYKVKGWFLTKTIHHDITVKDRKNPVIKFHDKKVSIAKGEDYALYENVKSVNDYGYGALDYLSQKKPDRGTYTIQSNANKHKKGSYKVTVYAKDMNGNTAKNSYILKVRAKSVADEEKDDADVTIKKGQVLVNLDNPLDDTYKSEDAKKAKKALASLQEAASDEGYDLSLLSGYRSYKEQEGLQQDQDPFSVPGYSEHQTGLAFDVGQSDESFGESEAGQWLAQNCASFGFIIRYPADKVEITQHSYAPWHIRYVGKAAAQAMEKKNQCLEEYLGVSTNE